ncbi:MAG: prolipoprotein diacylglyceryl transferase family protein, partial [Dokdonella sp.]
MHYFVAIDPVAVQLGPLAVHWYGIMYAIAFALFYFLGERRRRLGRLPVGPTAFSVADGNQRTVACSSGRESV